MIRICSGRSVGARYSGTVTPVRFLFIKKKNAAGRIRCNPVRRRSEKRANFSRKLGADFRFCFCFDWRMRFLKSFPIFLLLMFAFGFSAVRADEVSRTFPKSLDLYLLVGQSNMAGRGELEEVDREVHPRVFALGPEDSWEPASEPLHFDIKNRGT